MASNFNQNPWHGPKASEVTVVHTLMDTIVPSSGECLTVYRLVLSCGLRVVILRAEVLVILQGWKVCNKLNADWKSLVLGPPVENISLLLSQLQKSHHQHMSTESECPQALDQRHDTSQGDVGEWRLVRTDCTKHQRQLSQISSHLYKVWFLLKWIFHPQESQGIATEIIRNAFPISVTNPNLKDWNLSSISRILWWNLGPAWTQSLSEGPADLAEAL